MKKVNVDTSSVSTAAIDAASQDFDKHFTLLNRNQVINSQNEQEEKSLNAVQNMVEGNVNTVFESKSDKYDLLNQRNDGLPIITSVFSLATNITEVKQENRISNIEFVGSQFPSPPITTVIPNQFDYSQVAQHTPGILPFVVKCEPDGFITVSSPTRATLVGAKNQDMKLDNENSFTDCYKIPSSTTYVSDPCLSTNEHNLPLYVHDICKGKRQLEPEYQVFDDKSEDHGITFDNVPSYKQNLQYPFKYNNFTAEQLDGVAMRDTEIFDIENKTGPAIMTRDEKINRLKDLLRQKEEKVEKIRFYSKKKTLSDTIDKLKLNMLKRNNMACRQGSILHQDMETEELSSNATTLNHKLYSGDNGVDLVQDGNVKKERDSTTTENREYQRYETESSVHLARISTSASLEEGKKYKVDDIFGLGIMKRHQYSLEENVVEKRKKEPEVNDISNVLIREEEHSGFPKIQKGGPKETGQKNKKTNNKFKTLADLLA